MPELNEMDLQGINEIDMECSLPDDDDDSFMNIKEKFDEDSEIDSRPTSAVTTGITIDFRGTDEDNSKKTLPPLKYQPVENMRFDEAVEDDDSYEFDDDNIKFDLEQDNYEVDDTEEITEEMIDERKKKKTSRLKKIDGTVSTNYWQDLAKKHRATNVKGAYNTSFHFAGDPEREAELFNHAMGSDNSSLYNSSDADGLIFSNTSGDAGDGGDACCAESLEEDVEFKNDEKKSSKTEFNFDKLPDEDFDENTDSEIDELESIFSMIGFEVVENSDGTLLATDEFDKEKDINANNKTELLQILSPYIDQFFILPLQIQTGENFTSCKDWVEWYTEEMAEKYPSLEKDIDYCKIIMNNMKEEEED